MASLRPRRLIGVSTKMYLSFANTQSYITALLESIRRDPSAANQVDVFVLLDYVSLIPAISQVERDPVGSLLVGAQDCAAEDEGAFTGQVSPKVLAEAGCKMVMVGHAERRRMFGETDELVARKAAAAARNGMIPLVCVGERTRGGQVSDAVEFCRTQVEAVLASVADTSEVILAYEPVWAIGAQEPAGKEYVVEVAAGIRKLECVVSRKGSVRIVYGGSAGPGLFEGVKEGVDGLFLARFGLDVERFWGTVGEVATAS
ncbi:triosephosphate isomerase 2 [Colletotrichum truncatum]|uniref:Triosephosphate isomerase 2 n=1 Tax=Colletotrichum truncatum TaxID=5467 RepID=A0ACC3ZGQ7_COLTU|nr:triosephosphate isomerase 2 [Colletotrichum truncatum]KAF6790492.1 triosephosphate isomerase 2 [Colletotrichum truncatum]